MKRIKAEAAEQEVPQGTETLEQDRLIEYRRALEDLAAAQEKLETLRQVAKSLEADASGVATQREKVLSESVSAADEDGAIEELSRLRSRAELFERKIADVEGRIGDAEKDLEAELAAVCGRFGALYRSFYQWSFERQKERVAESLVAGTGMPLIEQAAWNSRAMAAVRGLEIVTEAVGGVLEGGRKLLEAVEREASFPIPAFATESPSGASEAQDGQPEHPPRGDMGVDVEAEIAKLRAEDPAITLPLALKRLYAKVPAIFVPVESPNEPLLGSIHHGH